MRGRRNGGRDERRGRGFVLVSDDLHVGVASFNPAAPRTDAGHSQSDSDGLSEDTSIGVARVASRSQSRWWSSRMTPSSGDGLLPLQVRLARAAELARLAQLGDDRVSGCPLAAACTRLTRPLANHPPLAVPPRRDRHPGGGQRQLPPVVRGCRLRAVLQGIRVRDPTSSRSRSARADRRTPGIACTLGDRAPSPTLTSPRPFPAAPPGTTSRRRIGRQPRRRLFRPARERRLRPPRGAFQHVAIFKNIVVAADGDDSARLHIFDVRDWSEKQVIRVGKVSEEVTGRPKAGEGLAPATVSALSFDGTTVAVGTHQGFAHTWRLAEHEGTRGYVRLLQPLKVDAGPITKLHVSGDAQLLTAYSAAKRTFVAWELDTGKLRGAFNVDGVARGSPFDSPRTAAPSSRASTRPSRDKNRRLARRSSPSPRSWTCARARAGWFATSPRSPARATRRASPSTENFSPWGRAPAPSSRGTSPRDTPRGKDTTGVPWVPSRASREIPRGYSRGRRPRGDLVGRARTRARAIGIGRRGDGRSPRPRREPPWREPRRGSSSSSRSARRTRRATNASRRW